MNLQQYRFRIRRALLSSSRRLRIPQRYYLLMALSILAPPRFPNGPVSKRLRPIPTSGMVDESAPPYPPHKNLGGGSQCPFFRCLPESDLVLALISVSYCPSESYT